MKNNEYLNGSTNIYIIGSVSHALSLKYALQFFQIQEQLEKIGFTIVNPIEVLQIKKKISYNYNVEGKLKKLIDSNWVYIMPDVSLRRGSNIEVTISLELNLKIILGLEEVV